MRETGTDSTKPRSAAVIRLGDYRHKHRLTCFNRAELNELLGLYSRMVARGEWRDYAIDHRADAALFSVFRHTQEGPLYTVVKRSGGFSLLSGRQRLGGGKVLTEVLKPLHPKPSLVRSLP